MKKYSVVFIAEKSLYFIYKKEIICTEKEQERKRYETFVYFKNKYI
jgi:hypothetical protein